jgi:hypothetical protein
MIEAIVGALIVLAGLFVGYTAVTNKQKPGEVQGVYDDPFKEVHLPPNVFGFFSVLRSPYHWREQVLLDMGYQEHGCDQGGAPTAVYGALSPTGRPLTYEWSVETNGTPDNVYSHDGQLLTGPTLNRLVIWFPGWRTQQPPYPVSVNPLALGYPPKDLPRKDTHRFPCVITVLVRDDQGNEVTYREQGEVINGSC